MKHDPPAGTHVKGTDKGEEANKRNSDPGRGEKGKKGYRSSRDSTGVQPTSVKPIDPKMTEQPPP